MGLRAGRVVSSVHPRNLILDLLRAADLDPSVVEDMKDYEVGVSQMGIYVVLSEPVTYLAGPEASAAAQVHLMPSSIDGFAKMFGAIRAQQLAEEPSVLIVNEATVDPSRVPEGRSSLKIILTTVPYAIDWRRLGADYAHAIIDRIDRDYIPDLKQKTIGVKVMTPLDYEADVASALHGTVTHGAMTLYQREALRPTLRLGQYRGPVRGLYLCGSGSHPGPGVSMMPGRNAARVIMEDASQ